MHHAGSYPPISDYGIIGAMHTCALVSKSGSIDWLCLPAFDSPAAFSRMLDWRKGGHFQIAPIAVQTVTRRYLPGTNVLETTFHTDTGTATLTDFMVVRRQDGPDMSDTADWPSSGVGVVVHKGDSLVPSIDATLDTVEAQFRPRVVRRLACTGGEVTFRMECTPRFDYGTVIPHATLLEPDVETSSYGYARGGGNAISVYCSTPMSLHDHGFRSEGSLKSGENITSVVSHQPFFLPVAEAFDDAKIDQLLDRTVTFWDGWSARCTYQGEYRDDVLRSALALKALTYEPSGALLAAATTSLPEQPAGERNWDYRFTWIRDATFSLEALHNLGYWEEARGFKRWLEWTAAYPEDLQIMYGLRGERWLTEVELPLEGYRWSSPVRIGNGAFSQFQLDIYGEILDSAYIYRKIEPPGADADDWEFASEEGGYVTTDPDYWEFLSAVVEFVIENWRLPDAGIWETRGGYRHFLYSKVMCWVALDRGIKIGEELLAEKDGAEKFNVSDALFARWSGVREEIRQDILANGYDPNYRSGQGAFVQSYGSKSLDASALMLPLVGFIEANDPMMHSTIDAIRRDLTSPQGFVYRYKGFDDGLEGDEGAFTICTFWLVRNLIALGEIREAQTLFETLRGYANDLGLLSEEINADTGEMLGNFPQAFSHLAFIDNAVALSRASTNGTPSGRTPM
jgi:GH15 family glucan-1,4-alpha-glucosidase